MAATMFSFLSKRLEERLNILNMRGGGQDRGCSKTPDELSIFNIILNALIIAAAMYVVKGGSIVIMAAVMLNIDNCVQEGG
eukprot:4639177-Amphidinium_carterae.1